MQLRRVGVLGGGPGGLYAARLLKLARPACDVIVYEQGEPGTTFGFGVGLAAGTDVRLGEAVFAPAETEHGTFVTHAYPYSDGQSTFLIETDEQTWRRAGFEATTGQTPSDASDLASLRYLQQAFSGQLGGHALIGNRTRWT